MNSLACTTLLALLAVLAADDPSLNPAAPAAPAEPAAANPSPTAADDASAAEAASPADPPQANSEVTDPRTAPAAAPDDYDGSADTVHRTMQRWEHFQQLGDLPPEDGSAPAWLGLLLPAEVFSGARQDLADLRLVDAAGQEIPFVVRVLRSETQERALEAERFNDGVVDQSTRELSLDLGETPPEHNQVDVLMTGDEFRRAARLEGSDDGRQWSRLAERPLARISSDRSTTKLDNRRLTYPPSRFRYLRLRIEADPLVDRDQPCEVTRVTVHYEEELPGEYSTWRAFLGDREATRTHHRPSSSWRLHLGWQQVPVERLLLHVADAELARDFEVEGAGPTFAETERQTLASGTLFRRPGQPREPLVIQFAEMRVTDVRLSLIDYNNPPVALERVEVQAAARELVFASTPARPRPWRLYYGHPQAESPQYDLERNLPATLRPSPRRLTLLERQSNPVFEPEPPPMSERWPWLIYLVLGSVSVVLCGILWDVGRRVIAQHDRQTTPSSGPSSAGSGGLA